MSICYASDMERPTDNVITEIFIKNDCFLLAMLGMESRRKFSEVVARLGLSWQGQNAITSLHMLTKYGPVSQKRLADFIGIDPRNIVSLIDTLERDKLVRRTPNPIDRRVYQLELSTHGKVVAEKIQGATVKLEESMMASLNKEEKETLHALLERLWEHSEISQGFRAFLKSEHADEAPNTNARGGV
jgi:DNA-binding MarR family transcriptional regulator